MGELNADLKTTFVTSISEGDLEKVTSILSRHPELVFAEVTAPEDTSSSSSSSSASAVTSNVLDLAVQSKQLTVLTCLVTEALRADKDGFENFLVRTEFCHGATILNEVIKHDPKSGSLMLSQAVTSSGGEDAKDRMINVNLKHLDTNVMETVLTHGCQEMSEHPVCKTLTSLKWTSYRKYAYSLMMMELLYIITLSATVILGNYHPNNSSGFLILLILSMFFHLPILTVKLASLINSNRDLLPKIKSTLYALHFLLFIIYFICSLCQVEHISIVHVTAWMILSSWILIMTILHDLPDTSFHVQMFLNVLKDILKFILIFLSVLIGFSLSLHSALSKNRSGRAPFIDPHNSILKLLSFMAGEISFDTTYLDDFVQVQGTVQILFILIFIILNIVMINIMIGLTLTSLHDTMLMKEQIKFVRTMLINHKIDLLLDLFKKWKRKLKLFKYRCCWNFPEGFPYKEVILKEKSAKDKKNSSLLRKLMRKNQENLETRSIGVFVANKVTDEIVETKHKLPKSIFIECEEILEARRLKLEEELAAEAEKCQGVYIFVDNLSVKVLITPCFQMRASVTPACAGTATTSTRRYRPSQGSRGSRASRSFCSRYN